MAQQVAPENPIPTAALGKDMSPKDHELSHEPVDDVGGTVVVAPVSREEPIVTRKV